VTEFEVIKQTVIPDSYLAALGIGIPLLLGFFYFWVTRKDKKSYESRSDLRDQGDEERDKLETARKVKKELTDEAEKIESIRKTVAELVLKENQAYTNLKVDSAIGSMDHKMELYKQQIESRFVLYEQTNESKFKTMDSTMENLLSRMIDIAKISSDSMVKINESIDALKKLLYELSGKINRAERDINSKQDKRDQQD
jgi:hypothetical protein